MTNEQRIEALAQDIYLARNNQKSDVTGDDLDAFIDQTIMWVNQLIPELEKKKIDWPFLRTNDAVIGTVVAPNVIAYPLPDGVRKLVINWQRDLTIRHDTTTVASFQLVNPNQQYNPRDPYEHRQRATVLRRQVIFSRPLTDLEVGGEIVADTIAKMPKLSRTDMALMDILDDEYNDDVRQIFIYGVLKNQILPDIVQGGLTPSYAQKFDQYLRDFIAEITDSADADDVDRESFAYVGGVGF